MSADSHQFEIGELPSEEGSIHVLVQAWEKPSVKEVGQKRIENALVVHTPCDYQMNFIRLGDKKSVLVCKNCLLRTPLPGTVQTISDLQEHLGRP